MAVEKGVLDLDIRIIVLQRGWVLWGVYHVLADGMRAQVRGGCVRRWGTSTGLGEISASGPTAETVLDPMPNAGWHQYAEIFTLRCDTAKWGSHLSDPDSYAKKLASRHHGTPGILRSMSGGE